jgi:hypothetical protein
LNSDPVQIRSEWIDEYGDGCGWVGSRKGGAEMSVKMGREMSMKMGREMSTEIFGTIVVL